MKTNQKKPKVALISAGRRLIVNRGCELDLLGGVYQTQREFGEGLVAMIKDTELEDGDTFHILNIEPDGTMDISEFSHIFMEAAKLIAYYPDQEQSDYDGSYADAETLVYED